MKKIFTIMAVCAAGIAAHGQGYIIANQVSAAIKTNSASFTSQSGGTAANTPTAAGGFYYALLYSQPALVGNTAPTNSGWSVVTLNGGGLLGMTNSTLLAGGLAGTGGSSGVQINLAAGTTYNVELVGWSASLGGASAVASVISQFATGQWLANGFFNYSSVATMTPFATAGTGDPFIFPTVFPNGSFSMYSVSATPVPEPSTLVLAGLGGLSLLAFRRKK